MTKWKKIALDLKSETKWTVRRPQVVCAEEDVAPLMKAWDALAKELPEGSVVADQVVGDPDVLLLDCGGPMWVHRHEYRFEIDGLQLRVPATDVGFLLASLDSAPVEPLGEGVRRSLGANPFWNWLLTESQLEALRTHLKGIEVEAHAITQAENLRYNKMVEEGQGLIVAKKKPVGKVEEA